MRSIIFLFCALFLILLPDVAFADTLNPVVVEFVNIFFTDKAKEIIGALSFILVVWTQIRATIPPTVLARLPKAVIVVLEVLAGNSGKSANAHSTDPAHIRKIAKLVKDKKKDSDG